MQNQNSIFFQRRQNLVMSIKSKFPQKKGLVLLFAAFENANYKFRQDSSFYYFTGIQEPGVVLAIDLDGLTTLYLPAYGQSRDTWMVSKLHKASKEQYNSWGIDNVLELGSACSGYQFSCLFKPTEYDNLINVIKKNISQNNNIFTINTGYSHIDSRLIIERLFTFVPQLSSSLEDISSLVAKLRRIKSQNEVEKIYNAVDCTMAAHEAVASCIKPDSFEYQLQAGIEFVFTESGATTAFPSIVASGANAAILHYNENKSKLKKGELVLIDIGAQIDGYCADISRTYPVSGIFSKREKEVYTIVLELQEYIADLAKPGMWLSNKSEAEKSLHHLAVKFLQKTNYGQYFTHSIGHFLGLDVHDVGDYSEPLKDGDVITIEPGIYIPEEKMGIRIEDDYWIVKDGVICLSADLPKDPDTIETLMTQDYDEIEQESEEDDIQF